MIYLELKCNIRLLDKARMVITPVTSKLNKLFNRYFIYVVLIFAAVLRFWELKIGLPYHYVTDEDFFINIPMNMLATGDLNPHWFGHPGSFIMYILLAVFAIYFVIALLFGFEGSTADFELYFTQNQTLFYMTGRILMVICSLIAIYLVFQICKRCFNAKIGLIASWCLAISPLFIEFSRYNRSDIVATMLVLFSIYFLIQFIDSRRTSKPIILSSLFAGFSIATKYPAALVVIPIIIYCLIYDFKHKRSLKELFLNFFKFKTTLSKAFVFILISFVVFAPFIIIDYNASIEDILYENKKTHLGHEGLPGIRNHLWYITNTFNEAIGGLFFEVFAGIGLLILLFIRRSMKNYILIIFPIVFFIVIGFMSLQWDRWMIPVLPFEAIFFAVGFCYIYKMITTGRYKISTPALRVILAIAFIVSLAAASLPVVINDIKEANKLKTDTRTIAKEWVEYNLPAGSMISYEYGAPQLHINPQKDFILDNRHFKKIADKKFSHYQEKSVDYIIISSYFKDRILQDSDMYPNQVREYENLREKPRLIKIFDNIDKSGPRIEIYELEN